MEGLYNQVASTSLIGAEAGVVLVGFSILLVGLVIRSELFERLVSSRAKRHLYLTYGAWGLPLTLLLMEIQRRSSRGGIFRFLGLLALVVIVVIIGVLALIAFIIYRLVRRRR